MRLALLALISLALTGAAAESAAPHPEVANTWHGTFTANFTSHRVETQPDYSSIDDGTYSIELSAPQDIAKSTVRFSAHGHGVTTFQIGCVRTSDTVVLGTKVLHGEVYKEGTQWWLGLVDADFKSTTTTTIAGEGCTQTGTFSKTSLTPSPGLGIKIAVRGGETLTAKGQGPVTLPEIESQPGGGYYRDEIGAVSGQYAYSLSYTPKPKKLTDYSAAGVCGRAKEGGHPRRCYFLIGAPVIRALKHHEAGFYSIGGLLSHKAMAEATERVAEEEAQHKTRTTILTYYLKKLIGDELADKSLNGYSYGKMIGRLAVAAIMAQRWYDLERPGFPHKCFLVQVSYDGGFKMAFDPIHSFVPARDPDAHNFFPLSASMGHWDTPNSYSETLPLFCKGKGGQAVALGSSSGLDELLERPVVIFSVDFNH